MDVKCFYDEKANITLQTILEKYFVKYILESHK